LNGNLLDTNVISLLAPGRPPVSPRFQGWIRDEGGRGTLYLSAITIAEMQRGIKRLERKGAHAKAAGLAEWLAGLVAQFDDRILPVDGHVAVVAGTIEDHAEGQGHGPSLADVLIAATASVHDLTVVTSNIRHFVPFGVAFRLPDDIAAS
jgi:predicted nucleic acid-binding protein